MLSIFRISEKKREAASSCVRWTVRLLCIITQEHHSNKGPEKSSPVWVSQWANCEAKEGHANVLLFTDMT